MLIVSIYCFNLVSREIRDTDKYFLIIVLISIYLLVILPLIFEHSLREHSKNTGIERIVRFAQKYRYHTLLNYVISQKMGFLGYLPKLKKKLLYLNYNVPTV